MSATTYNLRIDDSLKHEMDDIARSIGMTTSVVFNVFARQFVAHRGFPFEVVDPMLEKRFAEEMDKRYREMKSGLYQEHELLDI